MFGFGGSDKKQSQLLLDHKIKGLLEMIEIELKSMITD